MVAAKKHVIRADAHWKVTLLIAALAALVFLWPYLGIICFAAISAFLFYPIYSKVAKKLPSMVAAAITVFSAILIIVVPVTLTLLVAFAQGVSFASSVTSHIQQGPEGSLRNEISAVVDQVNYIIDPISAGQLHLSIDSIQHFFAATVPQLAKTLMGAVIDIASSIPALFTVVTIYLFTFMAFLVRGAKILDELRMVSPFDSRLTALYFSKAGAMIKASMLSQLLIAFVLAALTALVLLLVGAGPYFFFLVGVLTILNMIPLGSAPLVYIICGVAIATGNIAGAIWVFLIYQLVICNIDNFMRPRLIPKSVRLNTALMVLSIFCGLYYFGILGLVYGPLVMILLLTTYEMYVEYRQSNPVIATGK